MEIFLEKYQFQGVITTKIFFMLWYEMVFTNTMEDH